MYKIVVHQLTYDNDNHNVNVILIIIILNKNTDNNKESTEPQLLAKTNFHCLIIAAV